MNYNTERFIHLVKHPVKFRMFLLSKLPAAYFSGLKVVVINEEEAAVSVPYKWFSRNPFHSTYFACLAMAAEMSTGLFAMMQVYKRMPSISMLIIKMEASYVKKAVGKTIFHCKEGIKFKEAIEELELTGGSTSLTIESIGKNKMGEVIASFLFTWSFKIKA
jgi:hypothetical protein